MTIHPLCELSSGRVLTVDIDEREGEGPFVEMDMKDVRTSGNDGRHIEGAPSNKVDMCEPMTQSPSTSDNTSRFTTALAAWERGGEIDSMDCGAALRIAARVSAEPDEKMVILTESALIAAMKPGAGKAEVASAVIAAYRATLLAPEPPLSDEQISDRTAP